MKRIRTKKGLLTAECFGPRVCGTGELVTVQATKSIRVSCCDMTHQPFQPDPKPD